jgi:glycosyltransferase involved in cell wall biosynthesis
MTVGGVDGRGTLTAPAVDRPAVSAVLLTHDCEAYVADAVDSALAQDYAGPLEIVVSDDASSDGSFAIAQARIAAYRGPHRVVLRRRQFNSGSKSAHLNDVFSVCAGELLVSFDGDDIAVPARVSRVVARARASPDAQAIYSSFALIGAGGGISRRARVPRPPPGSDAAQWFARVDAYAAGATLAVRRAVVEAFGPLDPALNEDIQLPFRAALVGGVEYIDEPLVQVHRHAGSFTADWQRYASLHEYRRRMQAGIATAARARQSRLADIETAARRLPDQHERWVRLRSLVERSFREAEMTGALVSESASDRFRGLAALVRAGAYRDDLLLHAFLALAPRLYLRYRRLRLGLDAEGTATSMRGGGA